MPLRSCRFEALSTAPGPKCPSELRSSDSARQGYGRCTSTGDAPPVGIPPPLSLNARSVGCQLRSSKDAAFSPKQKDAALENRGPRTSRRRLRSCRELARIPRRRFRRIPDRNGMSRADRCPPDANSFCQRLQPSRTCSRGEPCLNPKCASRPALAFKADGTWRRERGRPGIRAEVVCELHAASRSVISSSDLSP